MERKILVEVSARHVHLSQEDLESLFGKGYELTVKKPLSQPGQFAAEERVTIVGPKRELAGVTILGPVRKHTQVELSMTDTRTIGIAAPIRESGDIAGSASCTIVGPKGKIDIKQGVIIAKRHIHLTPANAREFGLKERENVAVRIQTPDRSLTFDDVVVRISDDYRSAMHIDTDEGNAAGMTGETYGMIL